MKKLLILILFLIILFFSSNILAIDEISPNITIIFPENNSILNYTHIWLNWTADETLDWCVYSLNGAANDTSICLQTELNDSSIEKNLSYSSAGSQLVYIKIPKNSNVTSAYLNLSGFVKSYDDWSFSIDG